MANAGEISVRLTALTASFKKEMDDATSKTATFSESAKKMAKGAAIAFGAMSAEIGFATHAALEQEKANKRLELAFRATGKAANIEALKGLATDLQMVTNFGDDTTESAMAMLASFKLTGDQVSTLIPLVQDLAAFMGVDLATAARMVGVSIETGTNTMQRMGVAMNEAQRAAFQTASSTERVAMMADLMSHKVGGAARELADPFSQLKDMLGDLQEEIGSLTMDRMKSMASGLRDVVSGLIDKIHNLSPATKDLIGIIELAATGLAGATSGVATFLTMLPNMTKGATMVAPLAVTFLAVAAAIVGVIGALGALKLAWDSDLGGMKGSLSGFADSVGKVVDKAHAAVNKFEDKYLNKPLIYLQYYREGKTRGEADKAWQDYVSQQKYPGEPGYNQGSMAPDLSGVLKAIGDGLKASFGAAFDMLPKNLRDALSGVSASTAGTSGGSSGGGSSNWGLRSDADRFMTGIRQGVDEYVNAIGSDMDKVGARFQAVDRLADETFTDAQVAILDSGSALIDGVTGSTTKLGDAFNWLAEKVGPETASKIADALGKVGGAFTSGGKTFGEGVYNGVAQSGTAGSVMTAAVQGSSAGPWGAIGAVVAQLFTRSKGFSALMDVVNEGLGVVGELLGSFAKQLLPVSRATNVVVGYLADQLGPVLDKLNSVIGGAFLFAVKLLTLAIGAIIKAIGQVWNAIVMALSWIVDKITDALGWLGFHFDWADDIKKLKFNFGALDRAMKNLGDVTNDQTVASEEEAAATADVTEQVLNAARGYKLALTRYESTDANGALPFGAPTASTSGGNNTSIGTVIIVSDDPKEIWRQLQRVAERESVVRTGSSVVGGKPYSTSYSR